MERISDRLKVLSKTIIWTLNSMSALRRGADVVAASAQVEQLTRYQVANHR